MVQFFQGGPSRGALQSSILGDALGSGLGSMMGAYHANRSLESVLQDKALKNAPISERLTRLQSALAPHGAFGERVLQKRMGIEQQFQQEQEQKRQQQEQSVLAKALFGGGVTPDEFASLSPDTQLKYSQLEQKLQQQRSKQDILNRVFGEFNSQEQPTSQQVPSQGINEQQIAALATVDPALAKILQSQQKEKPDVIRAKEEAKAQTSADIKYNQELQETSKQHELKAKTLDNLQKLNEQGVTGKPYEKLLERVGLVNLTSEGRREFAADVKNLITDIRSILGGQFSNFEFQTILNAYPSADFSKSANAAIIKNLKEFQDIKTKEVEFAQQMKKENKGRVPQDFQAKVNEKVREYARSKVPNIKKNLATVQSEQGIIPEGYVRVRSPDGKEGSIPSGNLEKAKGAGYVIIE